MQKKLKVRKYFSSLPISPVYLAFAGLGVLVLLVTQEYLGYLLGEFTYAFSWGTVILRAFLNILFFYFILPLVNFSLEFIFPNKWQIKRILWLILLSLLTCLVHQLLLNFSVNGILQLSRSGRVQNLLGQWGLRSVVVGIISSQVYFWATFMLFFAARNRRLLLKQEQELAQAKLKALKSQLRPHFLFNTLNSISSLMDFDIPASQEMLNRLSRLLRFVLAREQRTFVSLEEELDLIENYLAIEQIRFADRMEVQWDLDERSLELEVPSLILQPIVENAIAHGISRKLEDGILTIKTSLENSEMPPRLTISVRDNGPGMDTDQSIKYGLGIKNVENRLKTLYHDDATVQIETAPDAFFSFTISLPAKKSKDEDQNPNH